MSDDPSEGKVVDLFGGTPPEVEAVTTGRVLPEKVLQYGIDANLKDVIVLGWQDDDSLALAMSNGETSENLLLLELAKTVLMKSLIE